MRAADIPTRRKTSLSFAYALEKQPFTPVEERPCRVNAKLVRGFSLGVLEEGPI